MIPELGGLLSRWSGHTKGEKAEDISDRMNKIDRMIIRFPISLTLYILSKK